MKAEELQPGDLLPAPEGTNHGPFIYKIVNTHVVGKDVVAVVRFFNDGGDGLRQWPIGFDVPHVRP